MITKPELADGIRFAAKRAAAALENVQDWDYQLGHQWTTADAFRHVAGASGALPDYYPMLDSQALSATTVAEFAKINDDGIKDLEDKSRAQLQQMILEGAEVSAEFVAGLEEDDLAQVVALGGYKMPKAEIVAQIWIHHQIAHAYEASARWPLL